MEHINLLRKLARSFSCSTGLEFDDLFQEAALAYLEGMSKYDINKGKVSTFMWMFVATRLKEYLKEQEEFKCKRQQVRSHQEALEMGRQYFSMEEIDVDEPVSFTNFFDSLSPDAQQIATVILDKPELFDSIPPKDAIKQATEMLQEKGISMMHIWCGVRDLKLAFN